MRVPFITLPSLDENSETEGRTTLVTVNVNHIVLYSPSLSKQGTHVVLLASGNSLYTPATGVEIDRMINLAQERASE